MSTRPSRPMRGFAGFPGGKTGTIQVPALFFSQLLPLIDDLAELKLTVYCFWALQQREGKYRYVRLRELRDDQTLLGSLADDADKARKLLTQALERATARGTLLHVIVPPDDHLYFMNTDRGRRAVTALERGDWTPGDGGAPVGVIVDRPNTFALYEQNIGPLTPMLADVLRDAETTYPADWIADAMQIAVENNKRNWRYVEAILKSWATEGRGGDRRKNEGRDAINPYLRDDYFRRRGSDEDES